MSQGQLGYQVPVRARDELDELAESFNSMSAKLAHENQLRRQMRATRRALDERLRERLAEQMARRFVVEGICQRAQRIAAYVTNDAEMDPQPLIERLWAAGKQVYLPIMRRPRMWFVPYTRRSRFVHNRFGIPEPVVRPSRRIPIAALDLVLMPLKWLMR